MATRTSAAKSQGRNEGTPRCGRLRWALGLLVLAAMCAAGSTTPAGATSAGADDLDGGYVATIAGTCEELVIGSRVVPTCDDTLLNVDFADGRVAFVFAGRVDGRVVLAVFSGGSSAQPDARTYELAIDRMSTVTLGNGGAPDAVVAPAEGTCAMRGDPTEEAARFECRIRSAGRETIARFRSQAGVAAADEGPAADARTPDAFGFGVFDQ